MSGPTPTSPQSFLQVVASCDNYRVGSPDDEHIVPWLLFPTPTAPAMGLLRPEIVAQLRKENEHSQSPLWEFGPPESSSESRGQWVSFARGIATPSARSRIMKDLCERWRDTGLWPEEIGPRKWRAELYPVYRNPFGARDHPKRSIGGDDGERRMEKEEKDESNYAFEMERSASGLFGIVTYGIHMTVYEEIARTADGGGGDGVQYNMWVPRRAPTKQTWPLYLDNSVAGGIGAGLGVFDCVVKESMEEASIPEEVVRRYTRAAGTVSYFFRTRRGWLQPEVEYVYDLRLPSDSGVCPQPLDGEVESFQVVDLIKTGLFKYNCAPVLIDFMIRHGVITPDNELDYQEIVTRLHGRFDYDRWALL